MDERKKQTEESFMRFAKMLQVEGFLYLPAYCIAGGQKLLVEENDYEWAVRLEDKRKHLFPMPELSLEELYLKCGRDTEKLRILLEEYVKQYEEAETQEQREQEELAEIMEYFPDKKLISVLVPWADGKWEKHFPGRHIGNTYMIYAVCQIKEKAIKMAAVTWELLEIWQVREEELYQAAKKGMPALFPYEIWEIPCPTGGDVFIAGSGQRCFGLGTLLYEESPLKELAQQKADDLYLFPLSVHEAAVFPVSEWQKEMLEDMAEEISPFGRSIWHYSRELNRLAFTEKEYEKFQELKKLA